MDNVPSNWQEDTVSDTVSIHPKRTLKKGTCAKYVSMADLIANQRFINKFSLKKYTNGPRFQNGDTLFARITPCLENGKTAYVDILDAGEVGFGSTEFIVLSGKDGKTNSKFVYYLSRLPWFRERAIKSMTGTSGRQRVQNAFFDELKYFVPPMLDQTNIAGALSLFDEKIQLNNKSKDLIEHLASRVFRHWFIDFEFPNEDGEPYKSSGGDFTKSELGEIPRRWSVSTIENLSSSIQNGGTPNRMVKNYWHNGTIPWFKTGELQDGPLLHSEERITRSGLLNSACKLWRPKTILVALYGASVGRLGILEIAATANQACSAIIAKPEYGFLFLFYSLLFSRDYLRTIAVGAAQQNINQQVIKSLRIITPQPKIAKMFQDTMLPLYSLAVTNTKQSMILGALRDTLLPKLISGELLNTSNLHPRKKNESSITTVGDTQETLDKWSR